MSELRACPFCGSANVATSEDESDYMPTEYFGFCDDCGAEGPHVRTRGADVWNRRSLAAAVEVVREALMEWRESVPRHDDPDAVRNRVANAIACMYSLDALSASSGPNSPSSGISPPETEEGKS